MAQIRENYCRRGQTCVVCPPVHATTTGKSGLMLHSINSVGVINRQICVLTRFLLVHFKAAM